MGDHGGDIWQVRAGGGGVPTAAPPGSGVSGYPGGGSTFVPYDPGRVVGTVTASRDVTSVVATGSVLGKVTAESGFVFAVNANDSVLGGVEAATDMGQRAIRDADPDWKPFWSDYWNSYSWYETWTPLGAGVIAEMGDVGGGVRAAAGSIRGQVRAGRDVLPGPIYAAENIGAWFGDCAGYYGDYGSGVQAGRTMAATVNAGLDVGAVKAGVLVSGNVAAGRDVGAVTATGQVPDMGLNPDVGDVTGSVLAGRNIRSVWANHDIAGPLTASTGGIRCVWAGRDITGAVTAYDGIGYLPGEVPPWEQSYWSGPIPAQVKAGRDITGDLTAQTGNIGWVKEYTGYEGYPGYPGYLGSPGDGGTSYVRYGGGVEAGRHVDGHVRALLGGIAEVFAGTEFYRTLEKGRVGGDVTAKKYDLTVSATGDVLGSVLAGWGVQLTSGGSVTGPEVRAPEGKADVAATWLVNTTVFGRDGAYVKSGADTAGLVTAGDETHWATAEILAAGAVSATVNSSGAAYVTAGKGVTGNVTGGGDVLVAAGEDVAGAVTSQGAAVLVTTAGNVSGAVTALDSVTITAGRNVTSAVTAGDPTLDVWGWADIDAGGDVTGSVLAADGAWVSARGAVSGAVSTLMNLAVVSASGPVTGAVTGEYAQVAGSSIEAPVTGLLGVEARALGDITAALTSEGGEVTAWAGRDVTGAVTAELEVYLEAGRHVTGDVTAGDDVTLANALVRAMGNVAGDVRASGSAEAWAGGNVTGDVLAGEGEAVALAAGMVQGAVRSDLGRLRVWAAQGTGRSSSGSSGDLGADWLMVLTNREGEDLTGSLIARDPAGPVYVAGTLLDPPPAAPPGPGDDCGQVFLAAGELENPPRAPRPPAGDTPANDLPAEPQSDWTWQGYLWRASELTRWWQNLDADRLEALQGWWAGASNAERWKLLKDLLKAYSPSDWDIELDKRIGPPPEIQPPPPPVAGPPAQTGPTDADLKNWENEASAYLKASAAAADAKIQARDEDLKWRGHYAVVRFRMANRTEAVNGGETPQSVRFRAWGDQAGDWRNFALPQDPNAFPVPLTEEGKQKAAALEREVKELQEIRDMSLTDKFKTAIQRALEAKDGNGNSKLAGELRDAVLELVQPANLAIMGGVFGAVGLSTFTPIGPFVVSAVGIFGYIMTGKTVIDVGYDGYMFISIVAGARRPQDFDKAADHFISLTKSLVSEGAGAAFGYGVGKVGKGLGKLKGAAGKADEAKKMAVRRADGKVQIHDGSPVPAAGGVDAAAHAGTNPVPAVFPPPGKGRFKAGPAPKGLSEAGKGVWHTLSESLGPDVMNPFVEWVAKDKGNLEQALNKLKSIVEKTVTNTSQPLSPGRRLTAVEHLVSETSGKRLHLKKIFDNTALRDMIPGLTLQRLLDDLDKIAELDGFIPTLKRLKKNDEQVKGVVAEIQMAAKDMAAPGGSQGVNVPFKSRISDKKVRLTDGTEFDIPESTDADNVSGGRLWQVKVGYKSLEPHELEAWLRQAVECLSGTPPGNATRIGLRVDAEAAAKLGVEESGQFKKKPIIKEYLNY